MPLFKVTGRIWVALDLRDFISKENNDRNIDKLKTNDGEDKENFSKRDYDDLLGIFDINTYIYI